MRFHQTCSAFSKLKHVIRHSFWWEIAHLGSLGGYRIIWGSDITRRYVVLSPFPSDQKASIETVGVLVEYGRERKVIQAFPTFCYMYINHCAT